MQCLFTKNKRMGENIHIKLVKGLKQGSYEDFDALYTLYADMLYSFILNLTKSPIETQDILQDTFMRIWQTRERINIELSFKTYLYTIARNLIIDSLRKQIDNVTFEEYICSEAFQQYSENNIERNISFDEFKEKLAKAKEKLTLRQKEIFELSREKGYSIQSIAETLQLSEKTVKNQLTLALKVIRSEVFFYFILLFPPFK